MRPSNPAERIEGRFYLLFCISTVERVCHRAYRHDIRVAKTRRRWYSTRMDEGRKRVIGIMAAILASLHMRSADDLFGGPQGSPRTDKLIAASVQWAEEIMRKVDSVCGREGS
jgi:hypothetical protein